jgi:hypothetical protein
MVSGPPEHGGFALWLLVPLGGGMLRSDAAIA